MQARLTKKRDVVEAAARLPTACKRLTPGPGYLDALTADNVDVVATPMSYTDVAGIVTTDGKHRPVGAAIWATGFDMSFQACFPTYS
jgi:cation diffusion facilitator CzcD-associated flavoprotein CzcO